MSKQQLINKSNVQKVGVKFYKYKKIYLVVIGSIIQADGVLFEGQAEAKETAKDLNVTEHYRVQISTFTVSRSLRDTDYDQSQMGCTNTDTSGNAFCVKRVTAHRNFSNSR